MRAIAAGLALAVVLMTGAQALASWGDGTGAWWMDGDEAPVAAGTGVCGTCTGGQALGGQGAGTGLGLGLGFGDGTMPAPQDGTGFGSPWTR
ncbi:hypothetical protein [Desulfovibrio sp. TomC]|uniref:hypothetical protein n=1 Tax=Desulfovibrio sp. TomC TaxID=1562888 RepID=UPI000575237D|nr:hypothetical protein [Desulfovibrio sp. TomC]KHK02480.1 hypothetical protein NY78_2238 [Desulfovibrio sp. TomC]